jgi:hypothetical protein
MTKEQNLPYRIAIAPHNSPWGVIKGNRGENIYRHTLSFANEELKTNYINKHLFTVDKTQPHITGDYKDLLADDKDNMLFVEYINETSFSFKVNPKRYKNMDELQNKDFCVVRKPQDPKYYFYTLMVQEAGQGYVKFLAELDIFFSLDLDDILSDTRQSLVRQGHIARYNDDGTPK